MHVEGHYVYLRVGSKCKGRPDNIKQTTKNKKKVF